MKYIYPDNWLINHLKTLKVVSCPTVRDWGAPTAVKASGPPKRRSATDHNRPTDSAEPAMPTEQSLKRISWWSTLSKYALMSISTILTILTSWTHSEALWKVWDAHRMASQVLRRPFLYRRTRWLESHYTAFHELLRLTNRLTDQSTTHTSERKKRRIQSEHSWLMSGPSLVREH